MYRWKLQIYNSTYDVSPTYSNAAVSEEREEGFMFLRKKMPNIRLTGRDFDLINDGSIRYKYILILEELIDGDYQEVVRGKFSKLDCKIDADVRSLEVTPVTVDRYTTFLEGLDIEYDFLLYNPGTFNVNYTQTSVLQIYESGSNKITNIIGGRRWEQDAKVTTDHDTLVNDYKFGSIPVLKAFISGVGDGVSPDVTGEYEDVLDTVSGLANTYSRLSDSKYKLVSYGLTGNRIGEGGLQLQGNDQDSYLGTLGFSLSVGTLTDADFGSVWQDDDTNQMSYIGYDSDNSLYCFRAHTVNTPPTGGNLTHVSGASDTTTKTYTGNGFGHGNEYYRWTIFDTTASAGDEYVFLAPLNEGLNDVPIFSKGAVFTSVSSGDQVSVLAHLVYARWMVDQSSIMTTLGASVLDVLTGDWNQPTDDIVSQNDNYKYVYPQNLDDDQIVVSDVNSTSFDNYGVMSNDALHFAGNFFTEPSDPDDLIPINIDEWTEQSVWFHHKTNTDTIQALTFPITLRHAYKLADVISVLLAQIDSNLTHQEAEAYSDYLYGSSNPIRSSQRTIFITPKSNIIETNYNRPATKTKIKFREIIDMLANVYNAYVDIDEDNKFIIEGADFFLNGRSYSSTNPGINLSEILTTRHLGNLTDRKNIFSYEADAIPQRVMWEWMDEVSSPFEGVDMIGLDEYVTEGNVVTKNAGQFSSDIDYITVNSDSISKDGFVILEANISGSLYTVSTWTDGGVDYQNGHLAISYMQQAYFIYNAICNTLNINGAIHDISVDGGSVMRYKIQELKIPKIPNFDTRRLITTNLGSGLVRQKTEDLSTGEINITIEHDTEL